MKIRIGDNLPIITAILNDNGVSLKFDNVLLDTGSAGTFFPFDLLRKHGIQPPPNALIREMSGIGGGIENVIEFHVESVSVGELCVTDFAIQAGNTDLGYEFNAILGFDFLLEAKAMIDFAHMQVQHSG